MDSEKSVFGVDVDELECVNDNGKLLFIIMCARKLNVAALRIMHCSDKTNITNRNASALRFGSVARFPLCTLRLEARGSISRAG